jgi:hypothetical protein
MKHTIRFAALVALATSGNALAVGDIAEVVIIDRSTGVELTPHLYRGEYWVAGKPGATYAIEIRSHLDRRLLAVAAVDGVNVISGATAGWGQTGYVFNPRQDYRITGWRKSDTEVAAFTFTASPNSYAARTGRPANVGVIGVALFRERQPQEAYISPAAEVPAPVPLAAGKPTASPRAPSLPEPPQAKKWPSAGHPIPEVVVTGQARPRQETVTPIAAQSPSSVTSLGEPPTLDFQTDPPNSLAREGFSARDSSSANSAARSAQFPPTPKLGTGHGEREYAYVTNTQFDRMQTQPNEVIRIRYDSLDNLIAMGIIEPFRPALPAADPFPASVQQQYVPDPPAGGSGELP